MKAGRIGYACTCCGFETEWWEARHLPFAKLVSLPDEKILPCGGRTCNFLGKTHRLVGRVERDRATGEAAFGDSVAADLVAAKRRR